MLPRAAAGSFSWGLSMLSRRAVQLSAAILAVLLVAVPALADQLDEQFDGSQIDPAAFNVTESAGFSLALSNGELVMEKAEGTANGSVRLASVFSLEGDFDVTVRARRDDLSGAAEMGIATSHLGVGGFSDVFFYDSNRLHSNILVSGVAESRVGLDPLTASEVVLRIRRMGQTLIHEYDDGGGFQQIASRTDPNLAPAVRVSLFLLQEYGNTPAHVGTFDDLSMTADIISPACGDGVVEASEACDDDDPSWAPGESCNASCELLGCADPDDSSSTTATDALFVLQAAVGQHGCDACLCDIDASGATTSTDALRVLQLAVGQSIERACPACI